jgi:hypothetical protein
MGTLGQVSSSIPRLDKQSPNLSLPGGLPLPVPGRNRKGRIAAAHEFAGVPKGVRTPVAAVRGRSPRPLDDGDAVGRCKDTTTSPLGKGLDWTLDSPLAPLAPSFGVCRRRAPAYDLS